MSKRDGYRSGPPPKVGWWKTRVHPQSDGMLRWWTGEWWSNGNGSEAPSAAPKTPVKSCFSQASIQWSQT